jgi:hypothetical protein
MFMSNEPNKDELLVKSAGSAEEQLAHFFDHYSYEGVQLRLWEVFRVAVTGEGLPDSRYSEEDIALFFDQLIVLVAVARQLTGGNRVTKGSEGEMP